MVILDDYQNFFEKMKDDNRLPFMIDLSIFENHFENQQTALLFDA